MIRGNIFIKAPQQFVCKCKYFQRCNKGKNNYDRSFQRFIKSASFSTRVFIRSQPICRSFLIFHGKGISTWCQCTSLLFRENFKNWISSIRSRVYVRTPFFDLLSPEEVNNIDDHLELTEEFFFKIKIKAFTVAIFVSFRKT